MQMKKISCASLSPDDMLSLLEITRSYCGTADSWQTLRPLLERKEVWGFYKGTSLVGYALFTPSDRQLGGSVTLTCFRYRWEYNDETSLLQMMELIPASFAARFHCLLMDVSRTHELNLDFYHRIGFCESILPSKTGRGNVVLLADLKSFPVMKKEKR